jgi:hypothetical protein
MINIQAADRVQHLRAMFPNAWAGRMVLCAKMCAPSS